MLRRKQLLHLERPDIMKNLIKNYGHVWILAYSFIYIPWFLHLEKTVTTRYHVMHVALDDYIPFNEYFIIPYLLWFTYVSAAILYFFFTNKEDYYRLCCFLFTGMTISLLICSIFPNGTDFRPALDPDKNIFTAMVAALYETDTNTNVFPSVHVYNSIVVHIGIMKSQALKKNTLIRVGSGILMFSITLSTVFLKQHSIVDAVGSVIMAGVIYPLVYTAYGASERKHVPKRVWIR